MHSEKAALLGVFIENRLFEVDPLRCSNFALASNLMANIPPFRRNQ
jgi:hypothetical protein